MAATLLLTTPQAHGRDVAGRFGVGIEQSLAGAAGFTFRYFTSDRLAILGTLGVDLVFRDGDTSAGVAGSAGFAYQLARSQHAHLSVGARLALGYRTLDALRIIDPEAVKSDLHVALELPLGLELWLADTFSVSVATGILIDFVPSSGAQLHGSGAGSGAPPGAVGVGLGAGSLSGSLSVLYYF